MVCLSDVFVYQQAERRTNLNSSLDAQRATRRPRYADHLPSMDADLDFASTKMSLENRLRGHARDIWTK
jgi:hypothetical protein